MTNGLFLGILWVCLVGLLRVVAFSGCLVGEKFGFGYCSVFCYYLIINV